MVELAFRCYFSYNLEIETLNCTNLEGYPVIRRVLEDKLRVLMAQFPILSLTGPRQSGKTTLSNVVFSDYAYVNLENLDDRAAAEEDPRRFLQSHAKSGVVIDEAQRVPALFSYLQGVVDDSGEMGKFVLTGSQNFLLLDHISQSLAGRVAVLHLMPFTLAELMGEEEHLLSLDRMLFTGGYPVLYDRQMAPSDFFPSYIQTYIERDVRSITNVGDLSMFQRFIKLCAGRVGQLLNLSGLANDLGVSYKTVQAWISILEASFVVFLLSPHHRNFNKRVVKQPKLYFYDTGLLCALLDIQSPNQVATHYLRGHIFESFVISDYVKQRFHTGMRSNAFFWRDSVGHEVDLLLDEGDLLKAVEIKSGETLNDDFFKGLRYFKKISNMPEDCFYLIHGGQVRQSRKDGQVLGWQDVRGLSE